MSPNPRVAAVEAAVIAFVDAVGNLEPRDFSLKDLVELRATAWQLQLIVSPSRAQEISKQLEFHISRVQTLSKELQDEAKK